VCILGCEHLIYQAVFSTLAFEILATLGFTFLKWSILTTETTGYGIVSLICNEQAASSSKISVIFTTLI